jgi:hypothetical protein
MMQARPRQVAAVQQQLLLALVVLSVLLVVVVLLLLSVVTRPTAGVAVQSRLVAELVHRRSQAPLLSASRC